MSALLQEEALAEWSGYKRRAHLERWLRQNQIIFTYGRDGRLVTTLDAVNAALIGSPHRQPTQEIDFGTNGPTT